MRPGKGVEAKNEARTTREQGAGSTSERKTGIPPPGDWRLEYEESTGGGRYALQSIYLIHTGRGVLACFVCRDPPTLLLFTTLAAISRAGGSKSLRPADRIRMLPKSGCRGRSRKHRWESCRRPPGLVPAPLSCPWRRPGVLLRPREGGGRTPPRDWRLKYEESIGGGGTPPKHLV